MSKRIGEISCIFHSGLQYTTSDDTYYVKRVFSMPVGEFTDGHGKVHFISEGNIIAKVF